MSQLSASMQSEKSRYQPLVYGVGFYKVFQLGVLTAEPLLQFLERPESLLPVLDQEAAEFFTFLATLLFCIWV